MKKPVKPEKKFKELVKKEVERVSKKGYGRGSQLAPSVKVIRIGAQKAAGSESKAEQQIKLDLKAIFEKATSTTAINKSVPWVKSFTIEKIKPELRRELSKAIQASTSLIKIHREEAIGKTEQRFAGWMSSIPAGGNPLKDSKSVVSKIEKPLRSLSYEGRRLAIDQGHKMIANINHIVARQNDAIAAIWHSHWRRPGYKYRTDHKGVDGHIFLIRDSWAMKDRLIKKGDLKFIDEFEMVGQLPYCSCYYQYISNLSEIPEKYLTAKGKKFLSD